MKPCFALILSHDPLAAALIGGAADLSGLTPCFPAEGESARNALRRLKPACVLADCDRDDTHSEAFVGPAMMTGALVAIFCSSSDHTALARSRRLAQQYDLALFHLPDDVDLLQAFFRHVAASFEANAERSGNSR